MGNTTNRAAVVLAANEAGRLSRYGGAPVLSEDSARETLVLWLQWCDPNGSHTDELALRDRCDPYTLDRAWTALAEMLSIDADGR